VNTYSTKNSSSTPATYNSSVKKTELASKQATVKEPIATSSQNKAPQSNINSTDANKRYVEKKQELLYNEGVDKPSVGDKGNNTNKQVIEKEGSAGTGKVGNANNTKSLISTSTTDLGPIKYYSGEVLVKPSVESPVKFGEFSGTIGYTGGNTEWNLGVGWDKETKNEVLGINKLGVFLKQEAQVGVVAQETNGLKRVSGGVDATAIGVKVEGEVELLKAINVYGEAEVGFGVTGKGKVSGTLGQLDFAVPKSINNIGFGYGGGWKEGVGGGFYVQATIDTPTLIINGLKLLDKIGGWKK